MAIATLFRQISKSQNFNSSVQKFRNFSTLSSPHSLKPSINHFQGRPISNPAETLAGFHEMVSGSEQKYYVLSKIGGVGETGSVASLAVRFANHNFPTVGVSTYPAYSHSGSFDQLEEVQVGELLVTPPGPHKETSISNECYEAAMSSFVGAVLEYTCLSQRSVTSIRCATKKIKFAKQRRGRMKGISHRGNNISFGNYALQVLEAAWITSKQLEAGRRALSRVVGRGAKIWVRVIPDKPVTARPAETRMGRGKGSVSFWVAVVQPGRILYEISGVSESIARKAVAVAASKLPVQTRFIISA